MRAFWGIAMAELKLQWRSRTLWATLALALLYAVPRAPATYWKATITIAASVTSLASLGLALIWAGSARRPERCHTADLVESSAMPRSVRFSAEATGSCLGIVTVVLPVMGLALLYYRLKAGGGPGGLAQDLAVSGLLIVPPLLAWLGLSRLVGRLLPPAGAYVVVGLLWVAGVWAKAFLPVPPEWSLDYIPAERSDLILFGVHGVRLLVNRGILMGAGVLAILLSCFPEPPARRWVRTAAPALLGTLLLLALAALPGVRSVTAAVDVPLSATEWAARARENERWRYEAAEAGEALVAQHNAAWAVPLVEVVDQVMELGGTAANTAALTVVEAPVSAPLYENGTYVIPERVFRRLAFRPQLTRRVIRLEMTRQLAPWMPFETDVKEGAADGVALYMEWCYLDELLGRDVALEEIAAWQTILQRMTSHQTYSMDGPPGPADGPSTDPRVMRDWLGEDEGDHFYAIKTALGLWQHCSLLPPEVLPALRDQWMGVIVSASRDRTVEDLLVQLLEAAP